MVDSEVLDPVAACSHQNEYLEKLLLDDVSVGNEAFHRAILLDHREKNRSKKQNVPRENMELLDLVLEKVNTHLVLILKIELLERVENGDHPETMIHRRYTALKIPNDSLVQTMDRKILVRMKHGRNNHVQKTHSELQRKNMDDRHHDQRKNFTPHEANLVHEMELPRENDQILEKEDIALVLVLTLDLIVRVENFVHHDQIRARDFHAQAMRIGLHEANRESADALVLPFRSLMHRLKMEKTGRVILQSQKQKNPKNLLARNMYQKDSLRNPRMIDKTKNPPYTEDFW